MIKEMLFKNFEIHKYFKVKLDPHITSLIGPSDIGKSSTLRGLEWLTTNKYDGKADSFIQDESKPAFVGIKTDNGSVSRKKGKGINIYKLNGQVLEAFGAGVPDEVQEFLRMTKLNFQSQFDAPYWFHISPGEVSKQLNQIVDLEIIDNSLSKLKSKVGIKNTEVKLSQGRLNEAETILNQMAFMKPMMKEYMRLEKLELAVEKKGSHINSLALSIKGIERGALKAEALRKAHSGGSRLMKIANRWEDKAGEVENLSILVKDLEKNMAVSEAVIPNIKPLISITNKWVKAKQFCDGLSKHITEIISEKETGCQREKELSSKEKKLKKIMGKTCPLCRVMIKS